MFAIRPNHAIVDAMVGLSANPCVILYSMVMARAHDFG
jgi:hypothetical protein